MKLRVLIIDDDKWYRKQLHDYIEEKGHQVFEADNSRAALEIIASQETSLQPVDLVFVDYVIPGENGIMLSRKIKEKAPHIMQIGFTEHDDRDSLKKLITGGDFILVLSKFAEDEAYARALNMALSTKRELRKAGVLKPRTES